MATTQEPGVEPQQTPETLDACHRCALYKDATQAVPGAGPKHAPLMIVGEQPGDQEDLQGKPFVGPAGAMLDRALEEAGVAREEVYVTNAVKHFKWEPRGKRRMHKTPAQREINACHYWIEKETEGVAPKVIVARGATALKSVLQDSKARLQMSMGKAIEIDGHIVVATYHPSYVLRAPDPETRDSAYRAIVDALREAHRLIGNQR